jgi:riboflavin synthase
MFTGLIRESATVLSFALVSNNLWKIECLTQIPEASLWPIGASIALNGVCLTLVKSEKGEGQKISFEVSAETLARTNLGDLKPGKKVHVEASLKVGDALGGHWVLGHVDGCGTLSKLENQGDCLFLEISIQGPDRDRIAPYIVEKGSIAVDGVSLTINSLVDAESETRFTLLLIPHTLKIANFLNLKVGDRLNLEADILGKFSARDRQYRQVRMSPEVSV